jgi:hypothetical protein
VRRRPGTRSLVLVGVVVSLLVAGVLSAWASTHPDGLEHVARSLGFADTATDSATAGSPLAGYAAPGVGGGRLASGVAGVVGVVVVGLVMVGLLAWLRRPSSAEQER